MGEGSTSLRDSNGTASARLHDRGVLIDAYIALLRETRGLPEGADVTRRANLPFRALFHCFDGLDALGEAAFDEILSRRMPRPPSGRVMGDRQMRIRAQVLVRANACEAWLPVWRLVMQQEVRWPRLAERLDQLRAERRLRLLDYYAPEFAATNDGMRRAILTALEALTEFSTWGDMRERQGLSASEGEEVWFEATRRLLPETPEEAAKPTAALLFGWKPD